MSGVIREPPPSTPLNSRRRAPRCTLERLQCGCAQVASSYACRVACCSSAWRTCLSRPAAAHLKSGTLSTDFEARAGTFRPAAPGVTARLLDGDQRLELRVEPGSVVLVLGFLGEPFLRFSASGVEANVASPTASSARVISASAVPAVGAAGPHVTRTRAPPPTRRHRTPGDETNVHPRSAGSTSERRLVAHSKNRAPRAVMQRHATRRLTSVEYQQRSVRRACFPELRTGS